MVGRRNFGGSRSITRRLPTFLFPRLHQRRSKMIPSTELQESLERHNTTFEALLGLIPPKYYIPRDEENVASGSKYHKHVKVSKELSKNAKRAKVSRNGHLWSRQFFSGSIFKPFSLHQSWIPIRTSRNRRTLMKIPWMLIMQRSRSHRCRRRREFEPYETNFIPN